MMTEKIALFDMDGTLADYDLAMYTGLENLASPNEPNIKEINGIVEPWIENRMELIKKQPGWWRDLPRLQLGFDILNMAEKIGFNIHILTKGPRSKPQAWAEKVEWCQRHLGSNINITITGDKGLTYGRVLVDDFPDYMNRWLTWRPRGLGIMPITRYNHFYKHPQVIIASAYNMDQVKQELIKAYEQS